MPTSWQLQKSNDFVYSGEQAESENQAVRAAAYPPDVGLQTLKEGFTNPNNVFNSFTYSVDLLGYSFMSLSTLFAAFAFVGPGLEKMVWWFLIANGIIMPFIALQTFYHPLIWGASSWAVTLPGATISIAVLFRRKLREL